MKTSKHQSIAPAPAPETSSPQTIITYNCQPCVRRKVKCDRSTPTCSSCARRKESCVYQAPQPPRPRKRKPPSTPVEEEGVYERLARYERMLREHGLLSLTADSSPMYRETSGGVGVGEAPPEPELESEKVGKLLTSDGKSRYIHSNLWISAADEDIQAMVDEDRGGSDHDHNCLGLASIGAGNDPLSQALLGVTQNLASYHPDAQIALELWKAYTENVEPLCRILHVPTTARIVEAIAQRSHTASRAQECLLFSIYHSAVVSTPGEDCERRFGEPKETLMPRYHFAVRQAFVNVSWLRTTEMPVLQALVMFLVATRSQFDPHTYWILAGVAVRIAQRMGLHSDSANQRLPPFEVQMRRRLFWQLLPLDGYAGQVSGTGISLPPNSWDTKPPLNCNDSGMWPSMTREPVEQRGASDMIFVLSKVELSNFYVRMGVCMDNQGPRMDVKSGAEVDRLIDNVESCVEAKYLRYCDIVNPLHFLTLAITRSAVNMVRLRNRMSGLLNNSITDSARRDLCALALKILDTNCAIYANPALKQFHWHVRNFFIKDAMLCVLTSLGRAGFLEDIERDSLWDKIDQVYTNYLDLLRGSSPLYVFVGHVTLEAWKANPPINAVPEPGFIKALQALRHDKKSNAGFRDLTRRSSDETCDSVAGGPSTNFSSSLDGVFDIDFNFEAAFNSVSMDWTFWGDDMKPDE
ncbi:mitogen-activated protein kinase [Xylariaceae sp. AK1471]|nr:mitogen-activated protein kinase [Xylariaceae sp. AK1471]